MILYSSELEQISASKMPSDHAKKKAAKKKEAAKMKGGKKAENVAADLEKVAAKEKSPSNGVENGNGVEKNKELTAEGECRNVVGRVCFGSPVGKYGVFGNELMLLGLLFDNKMMLVEPKSCFISAWYHKSCYTSWPGVQRYIIHPVCLNVMLQLSLKVAWACLGNR